MVYWRSNASLINKITALAYKLAPFLIGKVNKMKINWKEKLASRKFWAAVAGVVISLMISFGVPADSITKVEAIISSTSILAIYILSQGYVDGKKAECEILENYEVIELD